MDMKKSASKKVKKDQESSASLKAGETEKWLILLLGESAKRCQAQFREIRHEKKDEIAKELGELKKLAPAEEASRLSKVAWRAKYSGALLKIKFLRPAIEVARREIPRIRKQLSGKQKLRCLVGLAALVLGFTVGTGIAGLGTAVGAGVLPVIVTFFLFFFGLGIIEFIDDMAHIFRKRPHSKPQKVDALDSAHKSSRSSEPAADSTYLGILRKWGLPDDASKAAIEARYYKLAQETHPAGAKDQQSSQLFVALTENYDYLMQHCHSAEKAA